MKKTKLLPAFIMLMAGAITCIMTYMMDYSIKQMLLTLLIVLVVFYILGIFVKVILDRFTKIPPQSIAEEGEVVEKEAAEEEEPGEPNEPESKEQTEEASKES